MFTRTYFTASMLLLSLLATVGCGGSNQLTVESSQDPEASFGSYRIWAVAGPETLPDGFSRVELDVMQLEQLRDIAREVLAAKGYREGTIHNADIVFFAGLGQRLEYRVEHAPLRYRDEDGVYETSVARDEVNGPTTEVLVIDGFETPSMFHVFQGRATVPNVQNDYVAAAQALRAILDEIPSVDPNTEPRSSGGEEPAAGAGQEPTDGAPPAEPEDEATDAVEATDPGAAPIAD
ncbi:MAG: hypothetical protein DRJ42_25890 [Deltaproteobacteria bacterium]|nr:MAG: hypothetical protein DRJ42_25890 [Deltaproteobacteria bacterium]